MVLYAGRGVRWWSAPPSHEHGNFRMNLRCLMRHFHRMIRNFQMMSCLLRRTGLICRTDLIRLTILNRRMRLIRLWSLNCPQAPLLLCPTRRLNLLCFKFPPKPLPRLSCLRRIFPSRCMRLQCKLSAKPGPTALRSSLSFF